jgi:hypothetical protein
LHLTTPTRLTKERFQQLEQHQFSRVLPTPGGRAHAPTSSARHSRKKKNKIFKYAFNPSQNAIILRYSKCLKYAYMYMYTCSSKTLLKSLQKHCQTVFSKFLSRTIFIPAENTRHSEKPGQNPAQCSCTYIQVIDTVPLKWSIHPDQLHSNFAHQTIIILILW